MRIYVDEDMAAGILVRLLQKAGHDVEQRGAWAAPAAVIGMATSRRSRARHGFPGSGVASQTFTVLSFQALIRR
jgi:hypothetical protein